MIDIVEVKAEIKKGILKVEADEDENIYLCDTQTKEKVLISPKIIR